MRDYSPLLRCRRPSLAGKKPAVPLDTHRIQQEAVQQVLLSFLGNWWGLHWSSLGTTYGQNLSWIAPGVAAELTGKLVRVSAGLSGKLPLEVQLKLAGDKCHCLSTCWSGTRGARSNKSTPEPVRKAPFLLKCLSSTLYWQGSALGRLAKGKHFQCHRVMEGELKLRSNKLTTCTYSFFKHSIAIPDSSVCTTLIIPPKLFFQLWVLSPYCDTQIRIQSLA